MERNVLVGQLVVNTSVGCGSSLNVSLVLSGKENLKGLGSINLASGSLSLDLSWVYNILKDSILYSSQGTGTWAKSTGLLGTSVRLSEDGALSDDDNMSTRELLLKLTYKTLLDSTEGSVQLEWNVDDNSLGSSSTLNLLSSGDVKVLKWCLQLSRGSLKTEKFLSNGELELIWGSLY